VTVLADTACEACGSSEVRLVHRSRRTGVDVARCGSCRLVFIMDGRSPVDLIAAYASPGDYAAYLAAQRVDALRTRHLAALRRLRELVAVPARPPRLFDIGAGAGDFLALSRGAGFEVAGNEIAEPAIVEARDRYGISLHRGDVSEHDGLDGQFDAATMWCVLAHVARPEQLLRDAYRLLRPGGVLYFHTPRWCAIDTLGMAATRMTGGTLSQVTDRRVGPVHRRLYSAANLAAVLRRAGFEPLTIRPAVGYSLDTRAYLPSMGVPERVQGLIAGAVDPLVRRGLFARNILDVYARRPVG
jgi:SAM-dependent methyltransferase